MDRRDVRIRRVARLRSIGVSSACLALISPAFAQSEEADSAAGSNDSTPSREAEPTEPVAAQEPTSLSARAAQPVVSYRLHGTLAAAKAVSGHQKDEYGWGGAGLAAIEWSPDPMWGIQAELGLVALAGVDQTPPEGLEELGGATGTQLAIGLRGRPLAHLGISNPEGLWLSAGLGVDFTGGQVAPFLDAFVGYDFPVTETFSLGPAIGYLLVIEEKDVPRPDNANILLAGVHGTFSFVSQKAQPLDRDRDGIFDSEDKCPDEPEDKDGFEDLDGCPDPDNDQDKILDLTDRCPLVPEDIDEFEDEDGCPDPDNDQDKILDAEDECPLEPEDIDEFEDQDGCPDPDNDQDKIPDIRDLCPNEPEIVNGIADNDGCPDAESVRVVGDKIELDQKIHFWTNSDRIRGMSYPVLEKLAKFLVEHPEYVHVDIEGHADKRGDEKFNLDLSKRRAASIRDFLAKRGLGEERLSSEGFGASRPLVEGNNERAWFMNRRVEFVVTRNRTVKVNAETGEEAAQKESVEPVFGRDKEEVQP